MPQLPNFPQPPRRTMGQSRTFPEDLIQNNRNFYTAIDFVDYDRYAAVNLSGGGGGGFSSTVNSIKLPLPKRINDNQSILWNEDSFLSALKGLGGTIQNSLKLGAFSGAAAGLAGAIQSSTPALEAAAGEAINPFQFMHFRRPAYKEFQLSWTLAANTKKESETLKEIIKECKKAALPEGRGNLGGFGMKYPKVALVTLNPKEYLFDFKPCAILSVQVDHTGSGQPSFFNSGAPTVVNLTLNLKEIVLWKAEEIR